MVRACPSFGSPLLTGVSGVLVEAAKEIIRTEGVKGLLGRGLPTRLLANGLQGLLFSVLWKLFSDL